MTPLAPISCASFNFTIAVFETFCVPAIDAPFTFTVFIHTNFKMSRFSVQHVIPMHVLLDTSAEAVAAFSLPNREISSD